MKRTLAAIAWIVACAFLVGVAAQTPPPTEQQRPPDQEQPRPDPQQQPPRAPAERPQARAADDETVMLTGCLAAGEQPATFKLTDIRAADATAPKPGEMVGTTGIKTGEAIQLIGTEEAKLKGHVGHTVEVTGTLVPPKEGPADAPAAPQATPDRPATRDMADMRLNVKSFKHVDATCPPAAN